MIKLKHPQRIQPTCTFLQQIVKSFSISAKILIKICKIRYQFNSHFFFFFLTHTLKINTKGISKTSRGVGLFKTYQKFVHLINYQYEILSFFNIYFASSGANVYHVKLDFIPNSNPKNQLKKRKIIQTLYLSH